VSAPEAKASGKLWDGALDAQHAFGDLDGHRPALLGVHDAFDDGTAYRAELSARVDEPVLSDDPALQCDLQLPDSWWAHLAEALEKVSATVTDRVAVRQQYMDRAIPEFVGIPAPAVTCWTTAHADLHGLTSPRRCGFSTGRDGGELRRGQFTFSPASGDTNTAYEYKLATSATWTQPISGNVVSKSITPQLAGTQQLQVRAEDSAGRWGAKTIVKFNVAEGQTAIGRWHFDDAAPGSGVTTAEDTATEGTRHAATLYTTGAGWSSLARRGDGDRSLWLNDTSDTTRQSGYAATAAPAINTQSSFTVSAWAYLADASDFRTLVSQTGSDGSGFALYYSPGVQRWVFLWNWYENGVRKYLGANADAAGVPLKAWTHLTGVYNAQARTISLYVNGRLQGSPVALPSTSDATTADGTLQFGQASFTPGSYVNYWRGRVDEAAAWQRILTPDEIATEDGILDANGAASVELMGAWNPDGASGTTLANSTSGYGRTLTLSGGASLDGQAIVLNGTDGAASTPGPVLDDQASFTATTLVDVDSEALLTKPTGYTAQVIGQRSTDGSSWGFWYQLTGTDIDPETDTTIPVGKWYFGRLNSDGSFTGVVSDEAAVLGSPVRMTGTYDAPSGTIRFYLGSDENDADVTHPYTAVAGVRELRGRRRICRRSVGPLPARKDHRHQAMGRCHGQPAADHRHRGRLTPTDPSPGGRRTAAHQTKAPISLLLDSLASTSEPTALAERERSRRPTA